MIGLINRVVAARCLVAGRPLKSINQGEGATRFGISIVRTVPDGLTMRSPGNCEWRPEETR